MTWQPIETAPKDDREILLWTGDSRLIGYRDYNQADGYHTDGGLFFVNERWRWMPLPEPPTEGESP